MAILKCLAAAATALALSLSAAAACDDFDEEMAMAAARAAAIAQAPASQAPQAVAEPATRATEPAPSDTPMSAPVKAAEAPSAVRR